MINTNSRLFLKLSDLVNNTQKKQEVTMMDEIILQSKEIN